MPLWARDFCHFKLKLLCEKFKILLGVLGVLVFAGAVFGAYKVGQRSIYPARPELSRGKPVEGPTPTPVAVAPPHPTPPQTGRLIRIQNMDTRLNIQEIGVNISFTSLFSSVKIFLG